MPFTLDFVDRKPFRLFLMELAFKSVPLDTAIDRTAALLDIISLPSCVNATLPLSVDRCTAASAFERFAVDSTASLLGGNGTCKVEVDREVVGDLECTFVALESTPAYASFGIGGVAAFAFIIMSVLVVTRGSSISTGSGDSVGRLLMLMGAVMIAIAGILSLGSPSIEMCTARTWSLVVGFTLAFGLLLGRISSNYGSSIASTPAAGVFVVNIGLLLLWTFFPSMPQEGSMSTVVGEFERGSAVDLQMPSCSTGSIPVLITLVAVNGVLALVGLLVSLSKASQEFVVTMRSQYRSSAAAFFFALAGIVIATSLVMFLPDVSERTRVMIISFTALIVGLLALFFIGRVVVKRVGEVKPRGADGMYVTYGHMTDSQQRLKIVAGDNGRKSTTSSTFGLSRNDPAALNRFIPTESPRDSKEKAVGSAGRIIDDRDSNKAASDIDTKSAFRRPLTLADEMQGGSNDDFASRFSGVTLFTNKPGAFATGVDDDETVDEEREVMEAIPSPPPPLVARNTMAAPVEVEIPMPATDLDDDLPVDGDRIGTPLDGDDALIPPVQLFQHRQSAYQSMYSDGMLGDGFDSTADAASRRSTMMPSDAVSSMEEGGEMEESAEDIIASIEQSMRMRFDVGAEGSDAGGKRDVTAVAANVDDGRRESTMSSRLLAFSNGLQQARNSKDVPRQNM